MPLAASSFICLTFAALTSVPAAPVEAERPGEGVVLRYRFRQGESVRHRIEQQTSLLAKKGEYHESQETRTRTDQRFEVMSLDQDGAATLRMFIDGVRMEYAFNEGTPTVFDSSQKEVPAAAFAGVAKAIGRELADIRVLPTGRIEEIQPLLSPEELAAIPGRLGLDPDEASNLLVIFPERPLQVGDVWSDTFSTPVTVTGKLRQKVKILRQYRLESLKGGVATIAVKITPITAVSEPSMLVQLIQRTSSGRIRFDVKAGRTIGRTVSVDNTEIGWEGPDSSLRAVSEWSETALDGQTRLSSR